MLRCTARLGWSSRVSTVCAMMLVLQCQCLCRDGTWIWGVVSGCAVRSVRLHVGESSDGGLVAWDFCKFVLIRSSTL